MPETPKMATSKAKKTDQLQRLQSQMASAQGIAFLAFSAPTVGEMESVRNYLRENEMTCTVIKKTLIALAAKNAEKADFARESLDGNIAVICCPNDEVAPAAAIAHFKKESFDKKTKTSKFNFGGAIFAGKFLDAAAAETLGATPSREQSMAKIIGALRGGPRGIHSFLQFGTRGIKNALENADKFSKV